MKTGTVVAIVVSIGVLGVGGVLAFRWWQRKRLEDALAAQAYAQQQQSGGSWEQAVDSIGVAGCVAGAAYGAGIPPAVAAPLCAQLVPVVVKGGAALGKVAYKAGKGAVLEVKAAVNAVGHDATTVTRAAGNAAKTAVHDAKSAVDTITFGLL